jgi:adenosylmethionine-8-amino-7-oxononanoate aminotransferase
VRDKATRAPFPWAERRGQAVCATALAHGVWLRPLGNVVVIMPPLCVTDEQLELLVDAVRIGIEAACGK